MSRHVAAQAGFTLVELLSVITASSLFVGLILYFGISYWRYSSLLESDLGTFVSRLNAQDFVRESIGTSKGLITQNSIPDTNTLSPDVSAGANYWTKLHAVPSTVSVGGAGTITPVLYYRRIAVTTGNTVAMNGVQPYEDEFILYMNGTTKQLLLRSLANPNVADNRLRTSCPASLATTTCPADKIVLEDVASIATTYFSRSGNTINYQSSYDPITNAYTGPDFPLVEALQLNMRVSKKPFLQKTNATLNETVVRIALRNT